MIKLIIQDKGDMSVGLFPQSWDIETPFYDIDPEGMVWFANKMIDIYCEFANGSVFYTYVKNGEIVNEEEYDLQN